MTIAMRAVALIVLHITSLTLTYVLGALLVGLVGAGIVWPLATDDVENQQTRRAVRDRDARQNAESRA